MDEDKIKYNLFRLKQSRKDKGIKNRQVEITYWYCKEKENATSELNLRVRVGKRIGYSYQSVYTQKSPIENTLEIEDLTKIPDDICRILAVLVKEESEDGPIFEPWPPNDHAQPPPSDDVLPIVSEPEEGLEETEEEVISIKPETDLSLINVFEDLPETEEELEEVEGEIVDEVPGGDSSSAVSLQPTIRPAREDNRTRNIIAAIIIAAVIFFLGIVLWDLVQPGENPVASQGTPTSGIAEDIAPPLTVPTNVSDDTRATEAAREAKIATADMATIFAGYTQTPTVADEEATVDTAAEITATAYQNSLPTLTGTSTNTPPPTETPTETMTPLATPTPSELFEGDGWDTGLVTLALIDHRNSPWKNNGINVIRWPIGFLFELHNHSGDEIQLDYYSNQFTMIDDQGSEFGCDIYNSSSGVDTRRQATLQNNDKHTVWIHCARGKSIAQNVSILYVFVDSMTPSLGELKWTFVLNRG